MGALNPNHRLDALREDQTLRWQDGERPPVEDYLKAHPDLSDEDALVLIVGELLLRWERGEAPNLKEYQQRLPKYADQIAFQFDLNESLDGDFSDDSDGDDLDFSIRAKGSSTTDLLEIPGYTRGAELGRGPNGIVFRAENASLGRAVALKILHMGPLEDIKWTKTFMDRGRQLAKLDHPHLVRVYQSGRTSNCLFMVSDLCEGGSLADRLRAKSFTEAELLQLIEGLAHAAGYAHDRGLVLGSIHPQNVLFGSDGRAKITDFASLPRIVDSPYSAPPDIGGYADPEPVWDVYSLGAILYHALTGRPPGGPAAMPPHRVATGVSYELSTLVMRCLEARPDRRYRTGEALAVELRRLRLGEPAPSNPPDLERSPRLLIVLGVLLLVAIAVTVWYFTS